MRYRRLGDSGLVVSVVGVGCNAFGRQADAAAARGDRRRGARRRASTSSTPPTSTATPPGASEEFLGAALRGRRDDVVIATKFGMDMRGHNGADHGARGARRYVVRAVEASLRRLGTDHIDLYQMHAPDPHTPIEETLSALDDLVRAGKVRYVGCSNFDGWQIADAAWVSRTRGWAPFVSAQNDYNLLDRDGRGGAGAGVPPLRTRAAAVLPARQRAADRQVPARRTPRRRAPGWPRTATPDGSPGRRGTRSRRLEKYAGERGISMLDVAIGGLAARPAVASVIAGAPDGRTRCGPTRAPAGGSRRRRISRRWTRSADRIRTFSATECDSALPFRVREEP